MTETKVKIDGLAHCVSCSQCLNLEVANFTVMVYDTYCVIAVKCWHYESKTPTTMIC